MKTTMKTKKSFLKLVFDHIRIQIDNEESAQKKYLQNLSSNFNYYFKWNSFDLFQTNLFLDQLNLIRSFLLDLQSDEIKKDGEYMTELEKTERLLTELKKEKERRLTSILNTTNLFNSSSLLDNAENLYEDQFDKRFYKYLDEDLIPTITEFAENYFNEKS